MDFERLVRPAVAGSLLLVVLLATLGSAIREPRPHDIPVGLSAPPPMVEQLASGFAQNAPGAFRFTTYASEADALAALDRRDVVVALVAGQAAPRLIVAAGAGEAAVGAASGALTSAFAAQGTQLTVETVHALPAGDPHGIVLFFLILATLIGSVAAGALAVLPARGSWTTPIGTVVVFAACAGLLGVGTAAWLANGLGDGIWLAMLVVGLLSLAVGCVIVACGRIAGAPGVGLGAFVVVLLGIVSSGGPLGSAFLPDAYRALAPWLPVGPAYDGLRGALAFGGEGVTRAAAILSAWAVAGIVVAAAHAWIGAARRQTAVATA